MRSGCLRTGNGRDTTRRTAKYAFRYPSFVDTKKRKERGRIRHQLTSNSKHASGIKLVNNINPPIWAMLTIPFLPFTSTSLTLFDILFGQGLLDIDQQGRVRVPTGTSLRPLVRGLRRATGLGTTGLHPPRTHSFFLRPGRSMIVARSGRPILRRAVHRSVLVALGSCWLLVSQSQGILRTPPKCQHIHTGEDIGKITIHAA